MITTLLKKPLAILDIESTGLNKKTDRIIDLAIVVLHLDGREEAHTYRFNPGIPIPAGATAVHGIRDEDVQAAPTFASAAPDIAALLDACDWGGFNAVRYDIPLLQEEFARCGIPFSTKGHRLIDAQRIYHTKEPRDLTAAVRFYCNQAHDGAHGALADVQATVAVLNAQLERYPDLPRDIDALDRLCNNRETDWADETGKLKWKEGELVLNFGSKQGSLLKSLALNDRSYLEWIVRKDFPEDTKTIIRNALLNQFPAGPH